MSRLLFAPSGLGDHRPFSHLFDNTFSISKAKYELEEGDVVVFEGGTDIDSRLYNEEPGSYNQTPHKSRDEFESYLFERAVHEKIPMIGICRGAQLITALTGGKLIQHMNHGSSPWLLFKDAKPRAKAIKGICAHHQACIPTKDAQIIAESYLDKIPEIFWYPKIKALCIQGHPAWGNGEFTETCVELVKQYILGGK